MRNLKRLKRSLKTHLGVELAEHFDHVLKREVDKMMQGLRRRGFHLGLVRHLSTSEEVSEADRKLILALEEFLKETEEDK